MQTKMKKYSIIIALIILFASNTSFAAIGQLQVRRNIFKQYTDPSGNMYTMYKDPAITVITPKIFSPLFFTQGTTAKDIATSHDCRAVLNGTYFGRNNDDSFYPAGVRYKFGSFVREPYQPAVDKNLRVLLSWSQTSLDFFDNDSFDFNSILSQKNTRYANIWPRLVRDGKIAPSIVKTLSHWQRNTTRSGIIRNPSGEIKIVVSTDPISLPQFIVFAYVTWIWTGAFQFVNLDGWSSTSLITPYNSYKATKRLPSFICVY
jgi:hypothetical protein